ncbi:phenylalanine--tRNA ligase subunit beta [Acetobacter sp. AN02]|uniref:phenylalanine--tRNA ligase subunit beta n=1 Tax=Acetobacter sp. AN02 TaxID=2894186 RepID=UPI00243462A1|nr:phenylalanine--tRNA ligase subunit beta [Acetobacter sp. AN02]MDG6094097.1 phenylalanine--tRNA ligase subunit beta [Acetobacter sp. AN02]
MKFTLSWLREHLDTQASMDEICRTLNRIGLEVEDVTEPGAALQPFRTARILEAVRHPDADRLRVCQVNAGPEIGQVQVVCGAPNARTGIAVIFAPPGTYIPGSDITIKAGKIRGQLSGGMLCSLRELGLGEESDGIAELPEDTLPGQSYADFANMDDPVIEIAITPNRGDALSVRGIARDLAAAGLGQLKPFLAETVEGTFPSPVSWEAERPEDCPWVLGRAVRGVRNGPSPDWLRRRLESIGLRSVSTLVDITNFFTFDLGRPLHVFDSEKISGSRLIICRGNGETLRALNGKDYVATAEDCVIADSAGVQSFAGIMGGMETEVSDETTDVFIECALFDPIRTALSGRRLGIHSDARYRFERGLDQAFLPAALEAATRMILDLCGGEAGEVVSAGAEPDWRREATLRFSRMAELGGLDVASDEAVTILEHLGFEVKARDSAQVTVHVPSWRNDVAQPVILDPAPGMAGDVFRKAEESVRQIEPECDLIEEVLRIRGFDSVPSVLLPPVTDPLQTACTSSQVRRALAGRVLAARGLMETIGFSFVSHEHAEAFGGGAENLRLLNPIAADLDQMRPTPLINLLLAARKNAARGWPDIGLFETGPAFPDGRQEMIVAGVRAGHTPREAGAAVRAVSFMDAKADAWDVLSTLGAPMDGLMTTADAPSWYHPGRSGVLRQGPKLVLARFGEIHPRLLNRFGFEHPVVAFEVLPDAIPGQKRRRRTALSLSPLQPVRRDFAFLTDRSTPAEAILRAARRAERNFITDATLFDVYEGDRLPEGKKSVAIEVVIQPGETSLTDSQIEDISAKIVAAVGKATDAVLRG